MILKGTPRDAGYKMPAEWERHARTLMAWPVVEAEWPGPMEEILEAYSDAVLKIAVFEPVVMAAKPELVAQVRQYCGSAVEIIEMIHDDSWTRDNGPTMVVRPNGTVAGINWQFNAWGGKYPCENDNLVAPRVLDHYGIPRFDAPVIMEGGSVHVDGEGTLLTTEECLLQKNRNPHLERDHIARVLKDYLNIDMIIWLKKGLYGDDTDGHIDNVACFARPGVVLLQVCRDQSDPNHERSLENVTTLEQSRDAMGRHLEIIEIEQPEVEFYNDQRLTLSYLNFYFVNGGIVMPVFGGKNADKDRAAVRVLETVFPERKIVTVNGLPLARGGGNIHCLTQQMPG